MRARQIFSYAALMIILLVMLIISVYIVTSILHLVPVKFTRLFNAIVTVIILFILFRIISGFISRYLRSVMDPRKVYPLIFLFNVFGYFIIGVALLASIGIDVSSLILGGSLVTVVIGLAAQTVLANQFAGILIAIIRPFSVGDLVTINTWQYGGAFPTLFPKYFSVDRIEATGYTGTVSDITINYTSLHLLSGDVARIPNSIVFQAAVIIRGQEIYVKARYEVPKYIPFSSVRERIIEGVKLLPDYRGDITVSVDETTLNTYILMVVAKFNGTDSDRKRGDLHTLLMDIVEPLKTQC